jgi:hypothetical protein
MFPVPGRDGPNETILAFGTQAGDGPLTAFGSRPSPTEGYPRPSTWFAPSGRPGAPSWQEVLAARELFGGPNVVALGGMSAGPHGYFIAGTWIGPGNHVVAAVWHSSNGLRWTRDDSDPAFRAGSLSESYANDVADGSSGVLLGGTTAIPTPGNPTREVGALWYSNDGGHWVRLASLAARGPTVVRAVRALGGRWVAAGTAGSQPEAWTIDAHRRVSAQALPGTAGAAVDDLVVTSASVLAAGVTPAGAPAVWVASRRGDELGSWRLIGSPPAGTGWTGATVAASGGQIVLALFNTNASQVWRTARAG